MAIAPSNSRVLYAANSTKTWPFSANTVFSEIYRSGNFGRSWEPVHKTGMGVVHRLVVHPANPDVVLAASSTGLWLQSGVIGSWTNLFPEKDCLDVALDPDDSSIVYLGVRGLGLFKSFTSGATWPAAPHLVFNPTTTSDDPTTSAVETNKRQTIRISLGRRKKDGTKQTPLSRTVAVRFGNQINVHDTGGDDPAGWVQAVPSQIVPNPNPPPASIDRPKKNLEGGGSRRSDTFPAQSNEWINCLAVDPFDPDHIFVGSVGVLESSNGGQDWTVRGSIAHEDTHSLVFDETDEGKGLVYLANDGGIFSSGDGGATWPTMSLQDTKRSLRQGANLAQGLITSEFRHSAVRSGSCLAAIDHSGFIFSDDFDSHDSRWQFLFSAPDVSARHGLEQSYVFSCPESQDRYYIIDRQGTPTSNANLDQLVQFDFSQTDGLVDPPIFNPLSTTQVAFPAIGSYFPEEQIYLRYLPGPFAARFRGEERLLLFAAVNQPGVGFTIQSLRLARNGTAVIEEKTEATDSSEAFSAITFVPTNTQRAFAITRSGRLFERDFSNTEPFQQVGLDRWSFPENDFFVSRLVAVPRPVLRLYALSQHGIGRFDYRVKRWSTLHTELRPNETLLSLVAHPTRDYTMFLGTNRGVYLSEDGGSTWEPYRQSMPRVPITELSFDQGYLYAATLGRGLWRCRPCLG
jgi:hypothetical protein